MTRATLLLAVLLALGACQAFWDTPECMSNPDSPKCDKE
jgi:hypothetical protein